MMIKKIMASIASAMMITTLVTGCGSKTLFAEPEDISTIPVIKGKYIEENMSDISSRHALMTLREDGTVDVLGFIKNRGATLGQLTLEHKTITDGNVVTEQDTSWLAKVEELANFGEGELVAELKP